MAFTTIDDPSAHFQTVLYSGNGSTQSITNDGNSDLQPDWLWFKSRNDSQEHQLFDTNRGIAKSLKVSTDPENTDDPNDRLTAINSDGFSLGSDGNPNNGSNTYVCWQWKANGGSLTTASESGSNVGYSRQVNTTSGFAIIKYTGLGSTAAVIHGMGATPNFYTVKRLSGTGYSWYTYHHKNTSVPHTDNLYLNNTDSTTDNDTVWDDQAPSSTEIKIGTNSGVNADGVEYIMYAFAEKKGFSKFGKYKGNGNADGPFVFTGFKPAFILGKNTASNGNHWFINDNQRGINGGANWIKSDTNGAELTNLTNPDFLSNGFKIRNNNAIFNENGSDYVYIAFAEHPFVSSEGVPVTAK